MCLWLQISRERHPGRLQARPEEQERWQALEIDEEQAFPGQHIHQIWRGVATETAEVSIDLAISICFDRILALLCAVGIEVV